MNAPVVEIPRKQPSVAVGELIYGVRPGWADGVVRLKWPLLGLWGVVQLLSFNGLWRPGLDSALYRMLAHSLVTGQGYTIHGEPHVQAYAGLPVMLAGLEAAFGSAAWPGVVVMMLMATASVLLLFLAMRRLLPEWAAVVVTAGVAFNHQFVQQSHELMTDMPFFLAICLLIWGTEAIRTGPRIRAMAAIVVGLILAAMMRPTFWVLVATGLAWGSWTVIRLVRRTRSPPRRSLLLPLTGAVVLVAVVISFALFDPRTRGGTFIDGGYESQLITRLTDASMLGRLTTELPRELWTVVHDDLPRLFFGERTTGLALVLTLALLGGVGLLLGREVPRPAWAVLVGMLLLATLLTSSEPRYWLMVLPVLWTGWLLGVCKGARDWFRSSTARSWYTGLAVVFVLAGNLGYVGKLVLEQRSLDFLATYKDGIYEPVLAASQVIREQARPGELIVGPYPSLMGYWSGRPVLGGIELGLHHSPDEPRRLRKIQKSDVKWMVFPAEPYRRKDDRMFELIDSGAVYPANIGDDDWFFLGVFGEGEARREWWVAPPFVDELRLPEKWRERLLSDEEASS
jgi:hypothetical protein